MMSFKLTNVNLRAAFTDHCNCSIEWNALYVSLQPRQLVFYVLPFAVIYFEVSCFKQIKFTCYQNVLPHFCRVFFLVNSTVKVALINIDRFHARCYDMSLTAAPQWRYAFLSPLLWNCISVKMGNLPYTKLSPKGPRSSEFDQIKREECSY